MNKNRFSKIILSLILSISATMFTCSQNSLAAEKPMVSLSICEDNGEHFCLCVDIGNMTDISAFALNVAFNNKNARICKYDSETGEYSDLTDKVLSSSTCTSKDSPLKLGELFDSSNWGGSMLYNSEFPVVDNEMGAIKIVAFRLSGQYDIMNKTNVYKIYFKKIGTQSPEIRIAAKTNSDCFDDACPTGMDFGGDNGTIETYAVNDGNSYFSSDFSYDESIDDNKTNGTESDDKNQVTDSTTDLSSPSKNEGTTDQDKNNNSTVSDNNSSINDKTENEVVINDEQINQIIDNNELYFSDINDVEWAKPSIISLYKDKIISGYEDNLFKPNNFIKREELVKMVVSAKMISIDDNSVLFSDSNNSAWFNPYITAAFKNGIITGYSENLFGVGDNVTRQDLCTILYRCYFENTSEANKKQEIKLTDTDKIADYAADAVAYLNKLGIVSGRETGEFCPTENATRAEVAKVLSMCIERSTKK